MQVFWEHLVLQPLPHQGNFCKVGANDQWLSQSVSTSIDSPLWCKNWEQQVKISHYKFKKGNFFLVGWGGFPVDSSIKKETEENLL